MFFGERERDDGEYHAACRPAPLSVQTGLSCYAFSVPPLQITIFR